MTEAVKKVTMYETIDGQFVYEDEEGDAKAVDYVLYTDHVAAVQIERDLTDAKGEALQESAAAYVELKAELSRVQALLQAAEDRAFIPGLLRCDQCNFVLVKNVLHMQGGGISAGDTEAREVCPNDGKDMRRVLWTEEDLYKRLNERGAELKAVQRELVQANDEGDTLALKLQAAEDRGLAWKRLAEALNILRQAVEADADEEFVVSITAYEAEVAAAEQALRDLGEVE